MDTKSINANQKIMTWMKYLLLPVAVFLIMSNELDKKDRFYERVSYQHQIDSLRNDNEIRMRELNSQIEELRRDIEGVYHEIHISETIPVITPTALEDVRG